MPENAASADRTTIGVSEKGLQSLALLMSRGWFEREVDAFRVAISYALAHGLTPTEQANFQTKWNRGTVEQGEMLANLITRFHPTDRPYELAETLGDAGLREMGDRVRNGDSLGMILGIE